MRAVVLAGGKGRRLEPYTISFPKPLVPVGDMPILEVVIRQLQRCNFEHVTMATGHLAELLVAYFGDGAKWDVQIDYSREDAPLGTVAPLKLIGDLPESFLVMNGDVLTTLRYDHLFEYHRQSGAELTVACHRCSTQVDLGVIEFDSELEVTGYREKPRLSYDVSMGVYVFNRSVLDLVQGDQYMDFPTLVDTMIRRKRPVKVYLSDDRWLDIGRPADYAEANRIFQQRRNEFLPQELNGAFEPNVRRAAASRLLFAERG
ncbi:MAG: NTP transferase domain-containing protein [Acidobacteria bacterium]|nr:NTP transferase domain-containing protein [Acidobacteriota bacterium]